MMVVGKLSFAKGNYNDEKKEGITIGVVCNVCSKYYKKYQKLPVLVLASTPMCVSLASYVAKDMISMHIILGMHRSGEGKTENCKIKIDQAKGGTWDK